MLGNDQPISPVDPMYCADMPVRAYDPDKAKHHLKKAGMEGGTIKVHTSEVAGTGAIEQALMLQREADKIGLKIDVQRDPGDGYWSATWGKTPFFMSGWNMRPTANIMLTLAFTSDAAWNEAKWKNARFDELLTLGRASTDTVQRKQIYCEAQQLISDTGGVAIPCFIDYLDAMSEKVKGFVPGAPRPPRGQPVAAVGLARGLSSPGRGSTAHVARRPSPLGNGCRHPVGGVGPGIRRHGDPSR